MEKNGNLRKVKGLKVEMVDIVEAPVKGRVYFIAPSKEKGKHINLNQIFQNMW